MKAVSTIEGRAIPLGLKNVDTDVIIPAHWLKTVTREGLGKGAFETIRQAPGNPFDVEDFAGAPILIAGDNFGCGSSREHAAWAMLDMGLTAVIAPSFSDIFSGNAFKNGILLITLAEEEVDRLFAEVEANEGYQLDVDLEHQRVITPSGEILEFDVDAFRKHCLLNGLDDIGITLQDEDAIRSFEEKHRQQRPWLFRQPA